jgi:AcrR family transcriptional regulator
MPAYGPRKPGAARERLLDVALELFALHGVSGTSLQMIADELGVTKAAVYFQFQTKEDIVLAVISPVLEDLARVAQAAESRRGPGARRDAVLTGLVDLIVAHRRIAAILRSDPAVGQVIRGHPEMQSLTERIGLLLLGPDPSPQTRVAAAMVGGGLMMLGVDPMLADLDEDLLREEFLHLARRIMRLRSPVGTAG